MSRVTADLLRVLSIIAVIVIHATGAGEKDFLARHEFLSDGFIAVILNQLARFSVPVFVMLSGYGLTRKYLAASSVPSSFFRERAWKIALPYLFWSLVILIAFGREPMAIFTSLLKGTADYHFYFFVIIIQCYLLFPLLFLAGKSGARTALWILLLLAHLLLTQPAQYLYSYLGLPVPHWHNSLFVFWIFYFYTGMLLGRREPPAAKAGFRVGMALLALLVLAAMIGEYVYRSRLNPVVDYYNHFNRHTVLVYSLCVWGLFAAFDAPIRAFLEARPLWMKTAGVGAALSFFVYIFHTWILRGLERTFFAHEVIMLILVLTAASFGSAWLMHRLLPAGGRGANLLRTILGLPPG